MEAYDKQMKEIDTQLLALQKHLISGGKLDPSFREFLMEERMSLKVRREQLLKQYSLTVNTPQGDWDIPETLETIESDDSPREYDPNPSFGDSSITNIFTKKFKSPRGDSPAANRYRANIRKLSSGRIQVYKDKFFEMRPSERNPFFEMMSTQTDDDEETPPTEKWHARHASNGHCALQSELIRSIGGINARNISYVLDAFDKKAYK